MPTLYRTGQRLDHYQILRPLGQGGASRVYLAVDVHTQQEVVLKVPTDEEIGGAAIFARHLREAALGKRLCHPALQHHLNPDEPRSQAYLVLEYLRGCTLRTMMQDTAPALLPQEQVMQIISQVCDALSYVHTQGVIHQDIKPENIFVEETGTVRLLDFGIAHQLAEERHWWSRFTRAPLVGTPDYMAPERLVEQKGSVLSDVYAVGVVLYELLCGRTPFQETDGFAIVSIHSSHEPPDILSINPTLSPVLATVVGPALRKTLSSRKVDKCGTVFEKAVFYAMVVWARGMRSVISSVKRPYGFTC